MTQPTSVDMTFDTSLVDLKPNASFSTTESDPISDMDMSIQILSGQQIPTKAPSQSVSVQRVPTQDAYDQWASVYDTDGNMLQAIDDAELSTLLPSLLFQAAATVHPGTSFRILDLGCGTGRITSQIITSDRLANIDVDILGLDFSRAMLDIASAKLNPLLRNTNMKLRLECCDCFPASSPSSIPSVPGVMVASQHMITSALVLEHVPLIAFFTTFASLLATGGYGLITNMHADMGAISQAGFVNRNGVKVHAGKSFVYSIEETIQVAQRSGLKILDVKERSVTKDDIEEGLVGKRGLKWVNVKVWYSIVVKKIT